MKDFNMRAKIIKLKRKWVNFHYLRFGSRFLDIIPKSQVIKGKIDKSGLHQH